LGLPAFAENAAGNETSSTPPCGCRRRCQPFAIELLVRAQAAIDRFYLRARPSFPMVVLEQHPSFARAHLG
jgi:hypothetical protein